MREAGRRQVTLLVVGEGELGLHDVVIKARRRGLRGEMPTSSGCSEGVTVLGPSSSCASCSGDTGLAAADAADVPL